MLDLKNAMAARRAVPPPQGRELMLLEGQRGFFGQKNLLVLVAAVTLLLQCISFMTTLQGATLFLAGIFTLAPLFFALAVQSTAWFLAGSLRVRITPLRCVALGLALLCSTYYSYVGIYNNVNPPASYLAGEYAQIQTTLERAYSGHTAAAWRTARDQVNTMVSALAQRHTLLTQEEARLASCQAELAAAGASYAGGLRAPSRGGYADYQDYVKAYNAYLASITANTGAEEAAAREAVLARYALASEAELAAAQAQNTAALASLNAAAAGLAPGDTTPLRLEQARADLLAALTAAEASGELPAESRSALARLVQLYSSVTGSASSTDDLLAPLDALLGAPPAGLMPGFDQLAASLPGGRVTKANAQEMKLLMNAQILAAVLRVNALVPESEALDAGSPALQIADLHLKPLLDLASPQRQGMALFCLGLAALIDGLTLAFSLACRRKPSLLLARGPRRALAENGQVLAAQLAASLPSGRDPLDELQLFLSLFSASPSTLPRGYSLAAGRAALAPYERVVALLCQLDLGRIEQGEEGEVVLLRSRFLLFANELSAKYQRGELAALLEQQASAARQAALLGQRA
ncbi:hypothetical protein [Allofournierella sp.]|uniref:hypothetical protein n=1 Tax=Allofournierella sp. TaxID=1940256 RepID=UPI003AB67BA1